jgi:hypothetical protein
VRNGSGAGQRDRLFLRSLRTQPFQAVAIGLARFHVAARERLLGRVRGAIGMTGIEGGSRVVLDAELDRLRRGLTRKIGGDP